jgi:membrane fusion protein, multidrug efflux system
MSTGATPSVERGAAGERDAAAEPRAHRGAVYVVGSVALVVCVVGVVGLGLHRASQARDEAGAREANLALGPRVRVARATAASTMRKLTLQGEARAFASVTLYAKVSGYLRSIKVDKGDRVRAGQVLATIESPEIDSQIVAATADARNKRVNAKRFETLAPSKMVSDQEVEAAQANADVAEATQAALSTEGGYRVLRAPFDGVVTARFADPGALIQAATAGQSGALPIVSIVNGDRLRIYVYPDQSAAAYVRVGDEAEVRVPERAGFLRKAHVTRAAGELAPKTRTMLTEIDVDNEDGAILPGSFVNVTLQTKVPPFVEVPADALVMKGEKASVAVVDDSAHVHYRPVVVADDDGQTVRLASGLEAGTRVALGLGSDAEDGALVQLVAPPPAAPSPPPASATH